MSGVAPLVRSFAATPEPAPGEAAEPADGADDDATTGAAEFALLREDAACDCSCPIWPLRSLICLSLSPSCDCRSVICFCNAVFCRRMSVRSRFCCSKLNGLAIVPKVVPTVPHTGASGPLVTTLRDGVHQKTNATNATAMRGRINRLQGNGLRRWRVMITAYLLLRTGYNAGRSHRRVHFARCGRLPSDGPPCVVPSACRRPCVPYSRPATPCGPVPRRLAARLRSESAKRCTDRGTGGAHRSVAAPRFRSRGGSRVTGRRSRGTRR